jgi:sugar-specific transcriptional regulator TrmB
LINENEEQVLTGLGLTSSQARVYLSLARSGPSKVNAISQASHIHRTHLYEALKALEERGFVEKQLATGIYTAIPLKEAAQLLVKHQKQEISKLENAVNEIADSLNQKNSGVTSKPEMLLTSSKTYSLNRGHKYLVAARFQIDQMHTWKRFVQLWDLFESTFTEAMCRGVKIRQIVEIPSDLTQAKRFLSKAVFKNSLFELRFVHKTGGNLTIVDNMEVFMSTSQEKENLGETPLLFSSYEGLLGLMQNYYTYGWNYGFRWIEGELVPFECFERIEPPLSKGDS